MLVAFFIVKYKIKEQHRLEIIKALIWSSANQWLFVAQIDRAASKFN